MQRPAKPLTSVRFRAQPPACDDSVLFARVAEWVDARDLKSLACKGMPVQVRPRVPSIVNAIASKTTTPLAGNMSVVCEDKTGSTNVMYSDKTGLLNVTISVNLGLVIY